MSHQPKIPRTPSPPVLISETPPSNLTPEDLWRIIFTVGKSITNKSAARKAETSAILRAIQQQNQNSGSSHSFTSGLSPLSSTTNSTALPPGGPQTLLTASGPVPAGGLKVHGSLASWYASIKKLRPDLLSNYCEFLEAFVHRFDDTDKHTTALAKIQELKQEPGSVASYASKFAEILANLNLDKESKMDYFYDGLKDSVKDSMVFVKKP
ncbi:hypothetical protein DXG03_002480, partial [Asterophora parasitica]